MLYCQFKEHDSLKYVRFAYYLVAVKSHNIYTLSASVKRYTAERQRRYRIVFSNLSTIRCLLFYQCRI